MNFRTMALAAAFGFAFAQAQAADVEGSTSGVWVNPLPGSATVTGVGTPVFTWGDSTGFGTPPNQLGFAGNAFASAFETKFKVGTISYFNGTTLLGTTADTVDLSLSLNFTSPALGAVVSNYGFALNTTPNVGTPDENADFVSLPSLFSTTSFLIGSTEYRVKLTGFENVVGDGFLVSSDTEFHVREGGTASADLYAVVTTAPVPEPETYALMLAGLGAVGMVARRRRQQA
jgi:hypothetical protein